MKTSKEIKGISLALLAAQPKIEAATKGSINPHFKSKYADINSVILACKSVLNEHGILILQPIAKHYVETILIHAETGQWMSSKTAIIARSDNNPQDYGSAITYARRYGLQSMVLLSAEDDDGNAAAGTGNQPKSGATAPVGSQSKELPATEVQRKKIFALMKEAGMESEEGKETIKSHFKVASFTDLTITQAMQAIKILENKIKQQEQGV